MRIIVNESQYKSILKNRQFHNKSRDNWGNFIIEKMLMNFELQGKEEVIVENNLHLKLNSQKFYKTLPIKEIILNICEGKEKRWKYRAHQSPSLEREEGIIDKLEIEFLLPQTESILKEDIISILNEIEIKEQIEGYSPPIIKDGVDVGDFLSNILVINDITRQITHQPVTVSGVTDNKIFIDTNSITPENWGKIQAKVAIYFSKINFPAGGFIEEIGDNYFKFNNISDEEVIGYYYGSEKGKGGNTLPVSHSGLNDISYSARAEGDKPLINPNLINDIALAAKNAGVKVQITWAKTGHDKKTKSGNVSRHHTGNAIDISQIDNGNGELAGWDNKDDAKANGTYDSIIKFNKELDKLGYNKNAEYDNKKRYKKAYLTFGFANHDDHIHVSNIIRD